MDRPDELPPIQTSLRDERQEAIDAVLRLAEERELQRWAPFPSFRRRPTVRRVVATSVVVVVALALWLVPQPWLEPEPVPSTPAEQLRDGLRIVVGSTALRVADFRSRRGRLPDVLRELGEAPEGVTYERLDARHFLVRGVAGPHNAEYDSREPLADFVGDAWSRLREAP